MENLRLHGGRVFLVGMLIFAALCALGCGNSVKPNTAETTPPTLTWNVYNLDSSTGQDFTGNATINPAGSSKYRITFKASDPGGIKQITLNDSVTWECLTSLKPAPLGKPDKHGPLTDFNYVQALPLDGSGNAPSSAFLVGQPTQWTCTGGLALNPGSAITIFTGTSTNYANLQAQATLTLRY